MLDKYLGNSYSKREVSVGQRCVDKGSYWTKGDGGCSQAYEPAVSCMRLMDGICIFIAKLLKDSMNLDVLAVGDKLADDAFQANISLA